MVLRQQQEERDSPSGSSGPRASAADNSNARDAAKLDWSSGFSAALWWVLFLGLFASFGYWTWILVADHLDISETSGIVARAGTLLFWTAAPNILIARGFFALKKQLGNRRLAMLLLCLSAGLSVAVALGWRSVQFCFLVSASWAVSLKVLESGLPPHAEGLLPALRKNAFPLAATLAGVTETLWGFSLVLRRFPPEHLVDWGERLRQVKDWVETIGTVCSVAVIALIAGFYAFLLIRRRSPAGAFVQLWTGTTRAQDIVKSCALVLTAIASFSFTAVQAGGKHADPGPLEALTGARAQALSDYSHLVWWIRLDLEARLKLQVSSAIYQQLPPAAQSAMATELSSDARARGIPVQYFRPGFTGLSAKELLSWRDPKEQRESDWKWLYEKARLDAERHRVVTDVPPAGTTLSALRSAVDEAGQLPRSEDLKPPEWMQGAGQEVAEQAIGLSISADHAPFLRAVGANFPLLSEVLGVVFDSIDENLTKKITDVASRIAREKVLHPEEPLRERVRTALKEISIREPSRLPESKFTELERAANVRQQELQSAETRLNVDLARAISEQDATLKELEGHMKEIGLRPADLPDALGVLRRERIASDDRGVIAALLNSSAVTMDKLRAQAIVERADTIKIATQVVKAGAEEQVRLRKILGKDYATFEEQGQAIEIQNAHAPGPPGEDRPVEEHPIRVEPRMVP